MTLSEIENTLGELTSRHSNLNEELLRTLLVSSGWEEKNIKEAVLLFKSNIGKPSITQIESSPITTEVTPVSSVTVSAPQSNPIPIITTPTPSIQEIAPVQEEKKPAEPKEALTFYQPDGTEEGELRAFADSKEDSGNKRESNIKSTVLVTENVTTVGMEAAPPAPVEIKQSEPVIEKNTSIPEENVLPKQEIIIPEEIKEEAQTPPPTLVRPPSVSIEPQSLIIQDDVLQKRELKEVEIPPNLPLLPFESSPHIWSFSRYKDVFHSDSTPKEEIKVISVMPVEKTETPPPVASKPIYNKPILESEEEEEVALEKVPMTKGDESLVFLAGVMLLVIILILGYMYSNGRL